MFPLVMCRALLAPGKVKVMSENKRNVSIDYNPELLASIDAHGGYTLAILGKLASWGFRGDTVKHVVIMGVSANEIHAAYYNQDITGLSLVEAKEHMMFFMVAMWDSRDYDARQREAMNSGELYPYGGWGTHS